MMLRRYHGYVSASCESASKEEGDGRIIVSYTRARPISQTLDYKDFIAEFAGREGKESFFRFTQRGKSDAI